MRLCANSYDEMTRMGKIGKCQCADKVNTTEYYQVQMHVHTHMHTHRMRVENLYEWRMKAEEEKEEGAFLKFRSFQNDSIRLSMV